MINIRPVSDLRNKFSVPHIPVYMMPFFYVRAWLFCRSRQMIEIKQKYEGKDNE